MESPRPLVRLSVCVAFAALLVSAGLPRAMVGPGEWEVGKTASGRGEKVCLPDPALLMQWEHRGKPCTRDILTSSLDRADVQYACGSSDFGTSRMQVLTPRSIKINTQGIAGGLPFGYQIHARRVGDCPGQ